MNAAMLTYATIEEMFEAVFSVQSVAKAMSHCNKAATRRGVFYGVCPEAV
jgi:hypothetical protein